MDGQTEMDIGADRVGSSKRWPWPVTEACDGLCPSTVFSGQDQVARCENRGVTHFRLRQRYQLNRWSPFPRLPLDSANGRLPAAGLSSILREEPQARTRRAALSGPSKAGCTAGRRNVTCEQPCMVPTGQERSSLKWLGVWRRVRRRIIRGIIHCEVWHGSIRRFGSVFGNGVLRQF